MSHRKFDLIIDAQFIDPFLKTEGDNDRKLQALTELCGKVFPQDYLVKKVSFTPKGSEHSLKDHFKVTVCLAEGLPSPGRQLYAGLKRRLGIAGRPSPDFDEQFGREVEEYGHLQRMTTVGPEGITDVTFLPEIMIETGPS